MSSSIHPNITRASTSAVCFVETDWCFVAYLCVGTYRSARDVAPHDESGRGSSDSRVCLRGIRPRHSADLVPGDRCPNDQVAVAHASRVDAEALEEDVCSGGRLDRGH